MYKKPFIFITVFILYFFAINFSFAQQLSSDPSNISTGEKKEENREKKEVLPQTVRPSRTLGDHIFPVPVLFSSPIASSRFGVSQGFYMFSFTGDIPVDENENVAVEYKLAGAREYLDMGIRFTKWLGFDLDADINAISGINMDSVILLGAMTDITLKSGILITPIIIEKSGTLFSLAGRIKTGQTTQLSPLAAMVKLIDEGANKGNINSKDVKDALFISSSFLGFRPSLGFAQAIGKVAGLQLDIGYTIGKEKEESSEKSSKTLDVGAMISLDGRHIISFPLVLTLEYIGEDLTKDVSHFIGGGIYYQGHGEIQLGIFGAELIAPNSEIMRDISGFVGQFTLRYFF
jgi:hypothetical protein